MKLIDQMMSEGLSFLCGFILMLEKSNGKLKQRLKVKLHRSLRWLQISCHNWDESAGYGI
jgi:hypothetical protein